MITGFNTDIEHGGVTYHVQTEDKGVDTPLILSLVYNRGTILASKRTPYEDLLQKGFDEKILTERLQKQHKLICAAVRAGRIDDLKKMSARDAALKQEAKASSVVQTSAPQMRQSEKEIILTQAQVASNSGNFVKPAVAPPINYVQPVVTQELKQAAPENFATAIPQPRETFAPVVQKPQEIFIPAIPQPKDELVWDLPLEIIEANEYVIDGGNIVEAETVLAPEAVEIINDFNSANFKRPNLEIEFTSETAFKAGDRKTLNIRVFRGSSQNFISEAQVMVKVLGSSFRPLIFHARTNQEGIATVHLHLPQFRSGRGAILIRAISDGEEAELRQIVRQS